MARILVVTNRYPPHSWGGYELLCRDVVDRWQERHDVAVLTSSERRDDPPEAADAESVHRTLHLHVGPDGVADRSWWAALTAERRDLGELRRTLGSFRPDVVSVWNLGGLSAGLLSETAGLGYPVVLVLGDEWLRWVHRVDPWTRRFQGAVRTRLGRTVTTLTGVPTVPADLGPRSAACFASRHLAERSRDTPWQVARRGVVPHGIDPSRFRPPGRERSRWRGRLLYVGRLDPRKGPATPVRALRDLPDHTLTLAGGDEMGFRSELERLARELGVADRLRFVEVARSEVPGLYAEADAVVVPSVWDEPFGLVPLEAMAAGAPVLATATGGSGEFLLDGVTCLRFPTGDASGLAAAVTRAAADPELRDRLTAAGRRLAGWLTVDRTAAALEEWHLAATGDLVATDLPEYDALPDDLSARPSGP